MMTSDNVNLIPYRTKFSSDKIFVKKQFILKSLFHLFILIYIDRNDLKCTGITIQTVLERTEKE